MPDLEWIKQVVNTEGARCPYVNRACPGTRRGRDGCAHWIEEVLSHTAPPGQAPRNPVAVGGCLHAWQHVLRHDQALELTRVCATFDKVATEVAAGAAETRVLTQLARKALSS